MNPSAPIMPGSPREETAVFPTTALCMPSRASVHLVSAAYRFFSRLWLWGRHSMRILKSSEREYALSVELQPHADLVDSAFDFVLEDETDEELFDLLNVHSELLSK